MSNQNKITIQTTVDITPETLQAIVHNAKMLAGKDKEKGFYRVDTADMVSSMISKFLLEKDFESYVTDVNNFPT